MANAEDKKKKKKNGKNKKEEKEKIFSGFVRLYIVDSDGLTRKTNGSCIDAPLHEIRVESKEVNMEKKENEKNEKKYEKYIYTAHFPRADPVHVLKITSEADNYLCGLSWVGPCGKHDEPPTPNRTLLNIEAFACSKIDGDASSCEMIGYIPFLSNSFEKPIRVHFTLATQRFTCRVTSLKFELSAEIHDEWFEYMESLKAFDKEKKDEDGDDSNEEDEEADKEKK